jgi:hypothetical protein
MFSCNSIFPYYNTLFINTCAKVQKYNWNTKFSFVIYIFLRKVLKLC